MTIDDDDDEDKLINQSTQTGFTYILRIRGLLSLFKYQSDKAPTIQVSIELQSDKPQHTRREWG